MTGRILIVDDVATNVRLLEARLGAEYYSLKTASNGQEALDACANESFDLILLDVMMPVMDGFTCCKMLKANPKTQHIPVVLLTALDQPSDRVQGLEAGADDFLTKPVNDVALLTRVRSLLRLKSLLDELRMRAETSKAMGLPTVDALDSTSKIRGKLLMVDDSPIAGRVVQRLEQQHDAELERIPLNAIARMHAEHYDLAIINLDLSSYDGMRLCAQIRADETLRQLPILVLVSAEDQQRLLRAIDLGVNDYLLRPIEANEMFARVQTQVRRKHYADSLRVAVDSSMAMAITDALTGVHNRRYFESHIQALCHEAISQDRPLSLISFDIDYFKSVNDRFGHDIGDLVLKEFAARIKRKMRAVDLFARLGGEEFAMLMPDTNLDSAMRVADRLRAEISDSSFVLAPLITPLPITVSIGVTVLHANESSSEMVKRADEALYSAKAGGRNCVKAA